MRLQGGSISPFDRGDAPCADQKNGGDDREEEYADQERDAVHGVELCEYVHRMLPIATEPLDPHKGSVAFVNGEVTVGTVQRVLTGTAYPPP